MFCSSGLGAMGSGMEGVSVNAEGPFSVGRERLSVGTRGLTGDGGRAFCWGSRLGGGGGARAGLGVVEGGGGLVLSWLIARLRRGSVSWLEGRTGCIASRSSGADGERVFERSVGRTMREFAERAEARDARSLAGYWSSQELHWVRQ